MSQKVILITGASSGIGFAAANHLAKQGYVVRGTKLPVESVPDHAQFEIFDLDVTQAESIQACFAQVGRIHVLVNNAGARLVGAVEEVSIDEIRWQMEVNFFGTVQMVKSVLPAMRERRDGQIINMSSLLGITGRPFSAFYAASKHAIEGFTKSLRYEVAPFNVRVSMIEPGFVRTSMLNAMRRSKLELDAYHVMRENIFPSSADYSTQGFPPEIIAHTIQKIIENPRPHLTYRVFRDPMSRITSRLPDGLLEKLILWRMTSSLK